MSNIAARPQRPEATEPPRRRVPRARREQQILDVATTIFGREGVTGASMDEIAKGVGVTKPMLYAYFGSKEGLFTACAIRVWQAMGSAIYEAAIQPGAPDVRLWRGIVAYFDFIDDHREIWRLIYPEVPPGGGKAAAELRLARRGGFTLMAELFTGTVESERIDPNAEAAVPMAYAFVGAANAIADYWLEHPTESAELQSSRLMNFAWMGLGDLVAGEWWQPPPT